MLEIQGLPPVCTLCVEGALIALSEKVRISRYKWSGLLCEWTGFKQLQTGTLLFEKCWYCHFLHRLGSRVMAT